VEQRRSGGLDTRTVLALALMVVVWVVFTQFMAPKRKPPPPGGAATETSPASTGGSPAPADSAGGTPSSRASAPVARNVQLLRNTRPASTEEVTVEGGKFRAVFDPRGATLRSWKLTDYTDVQGSPVELIAPGAPGALELRLEGPDGVIDLSRTVFALEAGEEDVSGDRATSPGAPARVRVLRFVAEGPLVSGASGDSAEAPGGGIVRVTRTYRIDPASYDAEMEIRVDGIANPRLDHRLVVGWDQGIPDQEVHPKSERPYKAAVALLGQQLVKDGFGGRGMGCSCGGGKASRGGERPYEGMLRWAAVRGKYFTGILVPEHEVEATMIASSDPAHGRVGLRLLLPLADEGETRHRFTLYAGPVDYGTLRELDARLHCEVTRIVDFGGKYIAPISKATRWFLVKVHSVVPNYGLVILLLAIFVRVIFHPLTVKSLQSQRRLQQLKPELDRVNAEFKDKPELRTKKIMELHKRYGVNPLGGCLPLVVQMPVIWALYNVLMNAIELRKAPFGLWIRDLSAPDTIGQIAGIPINPLPLLMAATMFWQQKLTPTDPRQAPMLILMPIMMTFFFYGLPSGLVFYWTVTNLLAIAQQMTMKPLPELVPADETPGRGQGSRKTKRAET
jgi:YidC/Oxa1 family membrane protein insertase